MFKIHNFYKLKIKMDFSGSKIIVVFYKIALTYKGTPESPKENINKNQENEKKLIYAHIFKGKHQGTNLPTKL